MPHIAEFTHPGGAARNGDALLYAQREGGVLHAALCGGIGAGGALAAQWCANSLLSLLCEGDPPGEALARTQALYKEESLHTARLKNAGASVCVLSVQGAACAWANIGDARLYHFSHGQLSHVSVDDSTAYQDYASGKLEYADIRMNGRRSILTACINGGEAAAHTAEFSLAQGDALLLCSDGFWQYVFETEMQVDLCKSASPTEWLNHMLLRLVQRSHLKGDTLSAIAILCGEEGDKYEF